METTKLTVEVLVDAPLATNDVKVGGGFSFRIEARNKSAGFDFWENYTLVSPREHLHCLLGAGATWTSVSLPRRAGSGSWRSSMRRRPTQSSSSAKAGRPSWTASRGTWKAPEWECA
jgi:hypothetical protein